MAEMELNFGDDFLKDLLETDSEKLCEEMLNASVPILEESVKRELKSRIKHEGDSELVNSIKANRAKKTKDGSAFIVNVTPKGYSQTKEYIDKRTKRKEKKPRKYKVPNALKAIWKEYGIPGKQAPTPFLGRATRNVEKEVTAKMQEVYERKTGIK